MTTEAPEDTTEVEADPGPRPRRVLVVDDEEVARDGLAMALEDEVEVLTAADGAAALALLDREPIDLLITDLRMPGMSGLELLEKARAERPGLPVVVVTGYASLDTAVEAMRAGAADYVAKPYHLDAVRLTVRRALDRAELEGENRRLKAEAEVLRGEEVLVGEGPGLAAVHALIRRVADTLASVLITGESGTGKELVARSLHAASSRADRPFLSINCGALAPELIASELFGHEKGAFTGASARRAGLFEAADGGTVFLDEVGEIDAATQVALLRVLQEREVIRVGSTHPVKVDYRLLAATNRDLKEEVRAGRFRADLLYRIRVVEIAMPPLRERPEDIPSLAAHFLARVSRREGRKLRTLSPRALQRLCEYPWPGNVRELENVIERAVLLSPAPRITPSALPEEISRPADDTDDLMSLAEKEMEYIDEVLRRVGGNRTRAAAILGIDRSSLWRKLKERDG